MELFIFIDRLSDSSLIEPVPTRYDCCGRFQARRYNAQRVDFIQPEWTCRLVLIFQNDSKKVWVLECVALCALRMMLSDRSKRSSRVEVRSDGVFQVVDHGGSQLRNGTHSTGMALSGMS